MSSTEPKRQGGKGGRKSRRSTAAVPAQREAALPESPGRQGESFKASPHDAAQERRETGSALGRAMDMLQTILDSDGALGIQELCTRLELPRQSAHRILHQLLDLKLLQRHINGEQYTPGPRLRTLILKAAYQTQTTGPWHSVLQDLAKRTGETCNLGILDQNMVLLIDRVESTYALRIHSEIGRRFDPHASAIGKLLLAHLPKGRRRRILEEAQPLARFTEYTLTDIADLELEFAAIRRQGYSVSNQGTTLGMLSVAAPVRDPKERVVAGISYQAPFVRISHEHVMEVIVPALLQSAERLTQIVCEEEASSIGAEPR